MFSGSSSRIVSDRGGRQLILSMSMSNDHRMNIKHFRNGVIEAFSLHMNVVVRWDIPGLDQANTNNQGFGAFTWDSTFYIGGNSLSVKFEEDAMNTLRVYVGDDTVAVATIAQKEGFTGQSIAIMERMGLRRSI